MNVDRGPSPVLGLVGGLAWGLVWGLVVTALWLTTVAAAPPPAPVETAVETRPAPQPAEPPVVTIEAAAAESFGSDDLVTACDRSLAWLSTDESRPWFPGNHGVGHDHVRRTVEALRELLAEADSAQALAASLRERFECRRIGPADAPVLFTAYFAPEYAARRSASSRFRYPLHRRPAGVPPGNDHRVAWFARAEIERESLLTGRELAWLDDPLNVYLVHVNGSARLRLGDGETMNVGHSATNGRPYSSLGRMMIDAGLVDAEDMGLRAIRAAYDDDAESVTKLMLRNDRYVFFREVPDDAWPRSGLGIPLVAGRSLAIDPDRVPAGAAMLVETMMADHDGVPRPFVRLMLAQDRGGAIKGAGRCDLFVGVGRAAGSVAGEQKALGQMYFLLLKDDRR